jgi:hypothetical protein
MRWTLLCVCVCICLCIHLINLWKPDPIFLKLGMYIMTPEPISTAYFIKPSISLCVCMCIPPIVHGKRVSKNDNVARNTHATIEVLLDASLFNAVRVVSKESVWVCLCIRLSFLGRGSETRSRGNEELLEALFPMRSVPHWKKVGD